MSEERPVSARRAPDWVIVALIALIAAVLGGAIGGVVEHHNDSDSGDGVVGGPVTIGGAGHGRTVERQPGSVAAVAARIVPSVVSIDVKTGTGGDSGSGIVLSRSGYILTNNHVIAAVKSGGKLSVVLPNETKVPASVVGHPDPVDDIAVVKVPAGHHLVPAVLGNSSQLEVGDSVIAVGSPLGLAGTVTSGIVSALNRPVEAGNGTQEDVIDAIQTDAAINPGNSGGPLVDTSGAVVGVNSAIASLSTAGFSGQQSGNIGLGFAIPIDEAKRVAQQIIARGYATHAIIGVQVNPAFTGEGAKVSAPAGGDAITPGGPADRAGLKDGDVIVAVNGERITSADDLIVAIRRHLPGQHLQITYVRGGSRHTVTVTLGSMRSVSQ
ncbi:MAG TPA: trypsin-like peptidase domain-containing protein [Mycobacteriales bacterium]|nr:trypsin-like peptidase domain-containing protein [Mycobacteriales bacterium]